MKRYKLLKDLPFAKAGDVFKGELEYGTTVLFPEDYKNYKHKLSSDEFWDFDEWFEEVKEYFTIDTALLFVVRVTREPTIKNLKSLGLLFETEEEAKKYLEYLKAKVVIKQDTKGYKPDWNDENDRKYCGFWDITKKEFEYMCISTLQSDNIYFNIADDIVESFEKHPEEWKTYLTYEQ